MEAVKRVGEALIAESLLHLAGNPKDLTRELGEMEALIQAVFDDHLPATRRKTCLDELGRHAEARAALEHALAQARMRGDQTLARRIQIRLDALRATDN